MSHWCVNRLPVATGSTFPTSSWTSGPVMDFRRDALPLGRDRKRNSNPRSSWCVGSSIPIANAMTRPDVVSVTDWNSILALARNRNWNSDHDVKSVFLGRAGIYSLCRDRKYIPDIDWSTILALDRDRNWNFALCLEPERTASSNPVVTSEWRPAIIIV